MAWHHLDLSKTSASTRAAVRSLERAYPQAKKIVIERDQEGRISELLVKGELPQPSAKRKT